MAEIQNPYESPTAVITDVDADDEQAETEELQRYVNGLLNRAVIFSIIWVGGIGSFYSLFLAFKARRIIRESGGKITGHNRLLWCYLWGGAGALLVIVGLAVVLYNSQQP
jgi:hypothetical protein